MSPALSQSSLRDKRIKDACMVRLTIPICYLSVRGIQSRVNFQHQLLGTLSFIASVLDVQQGTLMPVLLNALYFSVVANQRRRVLRLFNICLNHVHKKSRHVHGLSVFCCRSTRILLCSLGERKKRMLTRF